jgi:signal transduction histidine kinase
MKPSKSIQPHPVKRVIDRSNVNITFRNSMFFRYIVGLLAMLVLYFLHSRLPFPYPQFFYVSVIFIVANCFLHLASMKKNWTLKAYYLLPYFDVGFAPLVLLYSGGFLSPFIIAHFFSIIGGNELYTNNKKLGFHAFIILTTSYLAVAFLQKGGIVPCHIGYVETLMVNNVFFYFIIIITTIIFTMGYILTKTLNANVHQLLDNLTHSFDSILQGTISVVGQDFFVRLTQHLSQSLLARCAMIAELTHKGQTLHSLAVWKDGNVDENFESPIDGTVFADVLSRQKCIVEHNTDALFLTNPLLAQCKAAFFFGVALNDSKGKPIGILCLVNDKPIHNMYLVEPLISIFASRAAAELERSINEEKQKIIELQLAHAHKMSAIGQLASGIAHDFNNMIGAVSGCAQLLAQKIALDSPHQRYIKHILDASRHTSELIGQLTRFSRRDRPEATLVDVNKTVEDTVEILRGTIHKKIAITKTLSDVPLFTPGDAALFANVLLNLGINARDAMEEQYSGTLSFSTATAVLEQNSLLCESFRIESGNYVSIGVSDTGIGMSKETVDHIFEPFFTTKPKGKGTGLGLSNVWGYVENYKGAIKVKSGLGAGSIFTLYFPLSAETSRPRRPESSAHVNKEKNGIGFKSILVVDDEPAMRDIASELLKNKGYEVFTVEDGSKAVEFVGKNHTAIDCVILDIMMPAMNGPDAFKAIRKIAPSMPIILASGFITRKELHGILNETRTAFVHKPFSDEQLLEAIRAVSSPASAS